MIPILFAKDETDFTTNGLGRLECISCKVIEERNGMYELEAEIPITGKNADNIEQQSIIGVIPSEGASVQGFSVYKIEKPMNGRFKVYGRHISYRLSDIPCMPFSVDLSPSACTTTLSGLKSNAVEPCPFDFYTDVTTASKYSQAVPASIRQRLGGVEGSVLDQFGGEYEWDNWTVNLWKARGRLANTTGITLRYGKNIIDLTQEEEIANTVTGVVPFWIDSDGNNLVTLTEKVVYSDHASEYPYHMTIPLDLSTHFEEKPTEAQLRAVAQQYVRKTGFGVPKVSIQVSFIDLWKTEEYKDIAPLEQVKLCDEIYVKFETLGVDAVAKVVKTTYDVLKERYESIEVGSIRSTLAQAITDRDAEIDAIYIDAIARANQIAQNATAWLTSANGYVVAVKNPDGSWKELLFMDTNNPLTARNGLRINNNGIGFWRYAIDGGNVLDGPYNNAWTIDGNLIADYITTGLLKSQNYTAPTIQTAPYAVEGMALDMASGNIHSEYFALTDIGAFIKGTIEASSGHIGAASIDSNSIKVIGNIALYSGSNSFEFSPYDYRLVEDFKLSLKRTGNTTVTVTVVEHKSTDTTIGTYTLSTNDEVLTATLNHTLGSPTNQGTYRLTITGGSCEVAVKDGVLAYMGVGGFKGVLEGIFKGYIESDKGEIAGYKYSEGKFTDGIDTVDFDNQAMYSSAYAQGFDPHHDRTYFVAARNGVNNYKAIYAIQNGFNPETDDTDDLTYPRMEVVLDKTNQSSPIAQISKYLSSGDYDNVLWEKDLPSKLSTGVYTLTDVDPGVGVPLEEGHFIIVYEP